MAATASPARATTTTASASDEGYFPKGSLLRRVHGERVVGLLYGQRALMVGAADARTYVGTARHTGRPDRPFNRLSQTGRMFETIFFGTRAEADRVLEIVARLHAPVRGELPTREGPWPAGTPYAADNQELVLWTLAVQVESAITLYETLVRRLSGEELEQLWQEYLRFGELFGLLREAAPKTYAAFRGYWEERMHDGRLHLTRGARAAGLATAFHIPVPWWAKPGMAVVNVIVRGTLPAPIRELYGLPRSPLRAIAFPFAVGLARTLRRCLPERLRAGRNTVFFDLIAKTEQEHQRIGRPTWYVAP